MWANARGSQTLRVGGPVCRIGSIHAPNPDELDSSFQPFEVGTISEQWVTAVEGCGANQAYHQVIETSLDWGKVAAARATNSLNSYVSTL